MALLDSYRQPLTAKEATHLLRRATSGPTPAHIRAFTGLAPAEAVQRLLADQPTPAPPIDPSLGRTFVDVTFSNDLQGKWGNYLKYWWLGLMVNEGISMREKLVLFWQNHFVSTMAVVTDARYIYRQNVLIRKHALGNFRTFVIEMTKDPAMLRYLNGNQNVSGKPNENYARELQELFTIGTGNYTEDDVKAAARVLTGWTDSGYRSTTTADITTTFRPGQHDTTDKKFSAFYQNTVIKGRTGATAGDDELVDLIDMILKQPASARFIVRKLYRWLINSDLTDEIEKTFIEPLAQLFRQSNFELKPVLTALLTSQHFFDTNLRGAIIKSPMELTVGTLRSFQIPTPDMTSATAAFYDLTAFVHARNRELQQDVMDQPTVFGWRPYYDTGFYNIWISSNTIALRGYYTDLLLAGTTKVGSGKLTIDTIAFSKGAADPGDPVKLMDYLTNQLLAVDLSQIQKDFLIDQVLIPGLPRYEWPAEWLSYANDPSNATKRMGVRKKLDVLFQYLFRMAEYQMN